MKAVNRRTFMRQSAMAGAVFGLQGLVTRNLLADAGALDLNRAFDGAGSYGPLFPRASNNTGEVLLAVPEGFQYNVWGKLGVPMSDGRPTPALHDGMAAFAVGSEVRIVRNHEVGAGAAFGARPYDPQAGGGTTTLVVDNTTRLLVRDFASQSGTIRNCAGGLTPWNSWITSEETTVGPAAPYTQRHGYNFDVPASANSEVESVPLRAMGRFSHEAVSVDPRNGVIYQTEDANPSGFYRFIPNRPYIGGVGGDLTAGGLLQMLAVRGTPNYDTRTGQRMGVELPVTWVDIDNPDPSLETGATSVVNQGIARGGAVFARLEGSWWGNGSRSVYFVSTSGGDAGQGQIWEYKQISNNDAYLKLIFESPRAEVLNAPDNICVSPRGGLVLCEDGSGQEYLHGLTVSGNIFRFAENLLNQNEFAGACFSPDGQTLFFNIQTPGMTFALWPRTGFAWEDGAL